MEDCDIKRSRILSHDLYVKFLMFGFDCVNILAISLSKWNEINIRRIVEFFSRRSTEVMLWRGDMIFDWSIESWSPNCPALLQRLINNHAYRTNTMVSGHSKESSLNTTTLSTSNKRQTPLTPIYLTFKVAKILNAIWSPKPQDSELSCIISIEINTSGLPVSNTSPRVRQITEKQPNPFGVKRVLICHKWRPFISITSHLK